MLWPRPKGVLPSVAVSWAGADDVSHLPTDGVESIDASKLQDVGEMLSLAVMVLATDTSY